MSAETDENGEFVIEDVPAGARRIDFESGNSTPLHVIADLYAGDTVTFTARLAGSADKIAGAAHDTTLTIGGIVTDATDLPLDGIEVYVVSSGRSARTDRVGRYRLDGLIDGPTELRARKLGWMPVDSTVVLAPHSNVSLNFSFTSRVSALDTIRVTATQDACQPRSFAGFDCRRKAGLGVFLDPATVNALNPRDLADLFDGVPGLRREGRDVVATIGWRCVSYLVNGHPPMSIEAMMLSSLDARDVMAVEFYADRNAAPEWYKIYAGKCSLIVLWTSSQ